ncbi:hypothetical protein TKK_0018207 [Trichogramma kaykai]|uniref:Uncharacterized protein n=1 Tax=Trichogramma kaykai TaxID=54128 RepID=A0ABD2VZ45_9HYME
MARPQKCPLDADAPSPPKRRRSSPPPPPPLPPPPPTSRPVCRRLELMSKKLAKTVYLLLPASKTTNTSLWEDLDEDCLNALAELATQSDKVNSTTNINVAATSTRPVDPYELRRVDSSDELVGTLDVESYFMASKDLRSFRPALSEKVNLVGSAKECKNAKAIKRLQELVPGAEKWIEACVLSKYANQTFVLFALRNLGSNFSIWSSYLQEVLEPALSKIDRLFVWRDQSKKQGNSIPFQLFQDFASAVAKLPRFRAKHSQTLVDVVYYRCHHALRCEPPKSLTRIRHEFSN